VARLVRSIPREGDSDNIGLSRTLRVFEQDGEHVLGFLTKGVAAPRLLCYLEGHPAATIQETGVVVASLQPLASPSYDEAAQTLRAMAEKSV
jgi:hypothetical protein